MIRFIRFSQSMIFMSIGIPVKVTAVNDSSANLHSMSVHIFGCGMGDDISSPFKRTAVYRSSEGVVYNKRNFMFVSNLCEFFNIKNYQGRVCDGLCEKYLCIRTEGSCNFFRASIGVNESAVNAKLFEGNSQEVKGSSVNSRSRHNMITCFADIEDCIEVGSLSGRGKDSGNTTLQICNFCCYSIICGVLQTGIEVSFCLKIEELSHFISSIIFISGTLINRECAWFTLRRSVTGMETFSLDFKVTHEFSSFLM